MALDPLVASSTISKAYLEFVGLDEDGKPNGNPPTGDYPSLFAAGYKEYAEQGIVLGADNSGSNESIIEAALGKTTTVTDLATAFANYWATVAVIPGTPAHGGTSVISVVNDASTRVSAFEAAIEASITTTESKPYFFNFVNNIETMAVSTIIWTVTELMPTVPPSPSPFPEIIS